MQSAIMCDFDTNQPTPEMDSSEINITILCPSSNEHLNTSAMNSVNTSDGSGDLPNPLKGFKRGGKSSRKMYTLPADDEEDLVPTSSPGSTSTARRAAKKISVVSSGHARTSSLATPSACKKEKKSPARRLFSTIYKCTKKIYNTGSKLRKAEKRASVDATNNNNETPLGSLNNSNSSRSTPQHISNGSVLPPVYEEAKQEEPAVPEPVIPATAPPAPMPAPQAHTLRQAPPQDIINVDGKQYIVRGTMGQGTYGYVKSAWEVGTGRKVAVKYFKQDNAEARREVRIYKQASDGCDSYLPKLLHTTTHNGKLVLITERQGYNLGHLTTRIPKRRFYPQTIAMLGIELMNAFEEFHSSGLIHRDIHMGNVLCGYRDESQIYLCDLGFSTPWRQENGKHVPREELQVAVGTSRFSSINNHKHTKLSRRDDMESLGYLLINALCGELPWAQCGQILNRRKKWDTIMKYKLEFEETDFFQSLPSELQQYLVYVKTLKFDEAPDYQLCRELFEKLKVREEKKYGERYFDWMYVWEQ